jgi:hypothetical protein
MCIPEACSAQRVSKKGQQSAENARSFLLPNDSRCSPSILALMVM